MRQLYKKDSKGKTRIWTIDVVADTIIEQSGLLDGKLVSHTKVIKGKNLGRSNETNAHQQAQLQAMAKTKKKKDEGYFNTIKEAETKVVILPMLAKDYKKECKKINWKDLVQTQPKLDGMRALGVQDDTFMSRTGKKIENLDHLYKELNILRKLLGHIPDGELYAHGVSFQDNMRLIKKYRPGETESVGYHVYDVVSDLPFAQRNLMLAKAFENYAFERISYVESSIVSSEDDLAYIHKIYLNGEYEGSIIRWGTAGYKINGRSSNLLKYKDFQDITAKVIDVIPSEARPKQGVIVCEGFKASLKMSHAKREEILTNKADYIGQTAEIRFFEYTDSGIPRFPVCVGFRLDK